MVLGKWDFWFLRLFKFSSENPRPSQYFHYTPREEECDHYGYRSTSSRRPRLHTRPTRAPSRRAPEEDRSGDTRGSGVTQSTGNLSNMARESVGEKPGRSDPIPVPGLCLAFLQYATRNRTDDWGLRKGQDQRGPQTPFSFKRPPPARRGKEKKKHAVGLRRRAERPAPIFPHPPSSRTARLPECACATRGGKRGGTLSVGRAIRPPTPPRRQTRRAHAPLSQSHGRAPRTMPDATRVR